MIPKKFKGKYDCHCDEPEIDPDGGWGYSLLGGTVVNCKKCGKGIPATFDKAELPEKMRKEVEEFWATVKPEEL